MDSSGNERTRIRVARDRGQERRGDSLVDLSAAPAPSRDAPLRDSPLDPDVSSLLGDFLPALRPGPPVSGIRHRRNVGPGRDPCSVEDTSEAIRVEPAPPGKMDLGCACGARLSRRGNLRQALPLRALPDRHVPQLVYDGKRGIFEIVPFRIRTDSGPWTAQDSGASSARKGGRSRYRNGPRAGLIGGLELTPVRSRGPRIRLLKFSPLLGRIS